MTVAEVPAPYSVRLGESKLNTVRDGWRHLRFLLVAAPDFLFVLPGLLLFGAGLAIGAMSVLAPGGIEIGSLRWQPVFAATILLATGANSLLFGLMTKTYLVRRGLQKAGRMVQAYRRFFSLERTLLLALLLIGLGVVLDGGLFMVWTSGAKADNGLQLAALAQSLIIVGANLGMAGFLRLVIDEPA